MVFYNYEGEPIAYCDDKEKIYLFSGEPVAYFYNDLVYNYNGDELGWFENGWIRDLYGQCVFYTKEASGGPVKPVCRITPVKAVRRVPIVKAVPQYRWSNLSNEKFFMQ